MKLITFTMVIKLVCKMFKSNYVIFHLIFLPQRLVVEDETAV